MVALKTERRIFMWGMRAFAKPPEAVPPVNLDEALAIIEEAFANGKARGYIHQDGKLFPLPEAGNKKNCIYIAAYARKEVTGERIFLINRGDPDAANVAFLTEDSDEIEPVAPDLNQMQGWSAHLVISNKFWSGNARRACFESMQNISASLALALFQLILDEHTSKDEKYFYEKMLKKGRKWVPEKRPYRLTISTTRKPSESLEEDLEKGQLRGITLISNNSEYTGLGSPGITSEIQNKIKIKTFKVAKNEIMEYINSHLLSWARANGFSEIQFDIDGLPGNQSSSPRFKLEEEDAMETLYARSQRIDGFKNPLDRCYSGICEDISTAMVTIVDDDARW